MDEINNLLKEAIDELNEQLDDDEKVLFSEDTRFIGSKSCIDSITFVTLITIIEDLIAEKFDKNIQLVNEKAFSSKNSPFYSIQTLSEYIQKLLQENN